MLDVVYNHLGPESNYLWDFDPYFTDRYKTLWGSTINFDGPKSDSIRRRNDGRDRKAKCPLKSFRSEKRL